ncbi:MAG: hypothetical protein JKX70_01150 [Phycisphaerales bacterium]|nr:hypothetical protein [Phycisphaerales bacterium]
MNQSAISKLKAVAEPMNGSCDASSKMIDMYELFKPLDGFYAFNRALLVRPLGNVRGVKNISDWNEQELWKSNYGSVLSGMTIFAEDVVGYSFVLDQEGRVLLFDPELGSLESYAISTEEWAAKIMADPEEVGRGLSQRWTQENGPIKIGSRLAPLIPYMFKESDGLGNIEVPELVLSQYRGKLYQQLKGIPDGEAVQIPSLQDAVHSENDHK